MTEKRREWSHVWIVGASSGIGRALAVRLAGKGIRVTASARSADDLNGLAAEFPGLVDALPLDVTDADSCRNAARHLDEQPAPPDLVVLAAGTYRPEQSVVFDGDLIRRTNAVNFIGTVNMLDAILPGFMQRGRGHIALLASVAGYRGLPNAAAYSASKAALIGLAESLQPALLSQGIRLRLINPGFVRTRLTAQNPFPMPFLIDPETAAAQIEKGLAGNRFEITFPKRFTWIMKLIRLLPYALYLPLARSIANRSRQDSGQKN